MKIFILSLAVVLYAFAQDVTPKDYAKQAQQERVQNEKIGQKIRAQLPTAAGYKKNDPHLRRKDEPYDQAGHIMRPD
jgi:hypothetical protein